MQKGKYLITLGIALSVICSAYLISIGIRHFSGGDPTVRVTGVCERNITSDRAAMSISIKYRAKTLPQAYEGLKNIRTQVLAYISEHQLAGNEVKQSSTRITKGLGESKRPDNSHSYYGDRSERYFDGYELSESISIDSKKVDAVEALSSSIGQLIAQGIDLEVGSIDYFYTKLNELKVEMLKDASANALSRAQIIAEGGQSKLGKLKAASMGVFQIVGLNSSEDYSWGGTYNISSKEKTASVTVKNTYILE